MNTKPKPNQEISRGTLRDVDLLEAYINTLKTYRPRKYSALIQEAQELLNKLQELDASYIGYIDPGTDPMTEEEINAAYWIIYEELPDALQDIAPAGYYFGSHPGDGGLIGYWAIEEW